MVAKPLPKKQIIIMNPLSEEEYFYKLDNMVLISCHHLRTLFLSRWKKESGKDWGQSENQGQELIEGLGKVAYRRAMNAQNLLISKGCLEDWDISLLSLVLQNLGNSYKSENAAVRLLTTLRNELAHHPSKKLSSEEYNIKVNSFRGIMQGLGVTEEEVEAAIKKAGRSSSVAAYKSTKRLYERGRGLLNKNKFEHAIRCYDEAIIMPSLLPIHQATAYEKRAECYLKFAQFKKEKQLTSEVEGCLNEALKDASRALELNEKSWQAHFTMAQAHRLLGDIERAIAHCRHSLAISPVEKKVQNELASSQILLTIKSGVTTHLNSEVLPKTLSEKLLQYSKQRGRDITEKEFLQTLGMTKELAEKIPGYNFFVRAHQYLNGWGLHPNPAEAVRHFTKAAELGFVEALHSLAICYRTGEGVPQDVSKAFELCSKAAQMDPDSPGRATSVGVNVGVAAAQLELGVMYDHGIVVEKDPIQAVEWFSKSSENGEAAAAFYLGLIYMSGRGVPINEKLAEFQWKQALNFGEAEAAAHLICYYKHHLEPEKALEMFKTGRSMGCSGLEGITEQEFTAALKELEKKRDELLPAIQAFEKHHGLDEVKGVTLMDRVRRMKNVVERKPPSFDVELTPVTDWRLQFVALETVKKWEKGAEKGCPVSTGVLCALEATARARELLSKKLVVKGREQLVELVNALYTQITSVYVFDTVKHDASYLLEKAVDQVFISQQGKKGDLEMKARLCFVMFNMGHNAVRAIELIQEGMTMYPDNVHFYTILPKIHLAMEDPKSAFTTVTKGLEKFPDNLALLRYKCSCLIEISESSRADCEIERVFAACQEFLTKAPDGCPMVPSICYRIACLYIAFEQGEIPALAYYHLGKQAEKATLSLGIPIRRSSSEKEEVETFLRKLGVLDTELKVAAEAPAQIQVENVCPKPASPVGVLERKPYLSNPLRKRAMLSHRKLISEMIHLKVPLGESVSYEGQRIYYPKVIQQAPKGLSNITPITLSEMSCTEETLYENRFVDLTIIDEPNIKLFFVQLVVEDENGEPSLVFIFDMDRTLENCRRLVCGRRISILNPYMQIKPLETETGIRVDDHNCLVYLGGGMNVCRFCGEENAQFKCGKCKNAWYCSKVCQEFDFNVMEHKLICRHIKKCVLY